MVNVAWPLAFVRIVLGARRTLVFKLVTLTLMPAPTGTQLMSTWVSNMTLISRLLFALAEFPSVFSFAGAAWIKRSKGALDVSTWMRLTGLVISITVNSKVFRR